MSINYIKYDAATDTQTDTVIFSGWDPFRTPPHGNFPKTCASIDGGAPCPIF